jgi:hypothetical protein
MPPNAARRPFSPLEATNARPLLPLPPPEVEGWAGGGTTPPLLDAEADDGVNSASADCFWTSAAGRGGRSGAEPSAGADVVTGCSPFAGAEAEAACEGGNRRIRPLGPSGFNEGELDEPSAWEDPFVLDVTGDACALRLGDEKEGDA